jgi:hypothetical protein
MNLNYNGWNSRREMQRDSRGYRFNTSSMKSAEDASSEAPKKDKKTTTKSRKANSFYLVVRKVNELFASFDVANQNTENKRAAIDLALGLKKKYYPDKLRFWQDLLDEAKIILDSRRFHDSCGKLKLDPQAVAEHLVLEGKANWTKVLKDGLESYGEKAKMFKERLYVDKYGLYTAVKEDE